MDSLGEGTRITLFCEGELTLNGKVKKSAHGVLIADVAGCPLVVGARARLKAFGPLGLVEREVTVAAAAGGVVALKRIETSADSMKRGEIRQSTGRVPILLLSEAGESTVIMTDRSTTGFGFESAIPLETDREFDFRIALNGKFQVFRGRVVRLEAGEDGVYRGGVQLSTLTRLDSQEWMSQFKRAS